METQAEQPDIARRAGEIIRSLTGGGRPMGSWTGLNPLLGAPLSGALVGALGGEVYDRGRQWLTDEKPRNRPWWERPAVRGAALGAGVGMISGGAQLQKQQSAVLQKRAAMEADYLIRTIERDPSIAYYEKTRLVGLVRQANPSQLSRLAGLAAGGALTAAAAHTILGTGFFGSAVVGSLAGLALGRIFPSSPKYV